jgi:hypothetical protein
MAAQSREAADGIPGAFRLSGAHEDDAERAVRAGSQ